MESKLKQAKTMQEILDVVAQEYNLHEPLGFVTKQVVITGLGKVLKMINAKKHETNSKTANY